MTTRVTIPDGHLPIVLPNQIYEELISLLGMIRRNKRLHITPAIREIAGDVILASLDTTPNQSLIERIQRDRIGERNG